MEDSERKTEHHVLMGGVHVYKRENSRCWQCSTYLNGRNWRKSTGEESLSHAKDFAEDWYLELKGRHRAGTLKEGKLFRAAAGQFLREYEVLTQDIAQGEQQEIRQAVQLGLPVIIGEPIRILYVQMDGTGVPVVKKETEGRKGKTDGQPAHTREVKRGCVFTQTTWDQEGYAIRDPDSTTYTSAIETAEEFGKRIYVEAWKRGWSRAQKKVVIGDGAEWIWNLTDQHFPGAVQIVDLYHARQHLWELARRLHPNDPLSQKAWMKVHQKRLLDKGKIEKLVLSLRSTESTNAEVLEKLRTEADYFERNAKRMRYPKFRRQHLFVGSGVFEAGCKTVIGSRLKKSGMFWTVRGANAIIALRCCHLNGRFEDYWEARRAARHSLLCRPPFSNLPANETPLGPARRPFAGRFVRNSQRHTAVLRKPQQESRSAEAQSA